jgi:hypothetical protein
MILFISTFSWSDSRSFPRTWLGLFSKNNFAENTYFWQEVQLRYDNQSTTMQQTLLRFGPLKKITPHQEIGLILCFVQTGLTKEYRPTFQHIYKWDEFNQYHFSLRSRLEARQIEDNPDFSLRTRFQLRLQKNINTDYSFVTWEEPWFNLTDDNWTGNRTFERNRAFLGMRFTSFALQPEIGYLHQFVPRHNRDTHEHILTLYLFY